jgi:hypothetical protein
MIIDSQMAQRAKLLLTSPYLSTRVSPITWREYRWTIAHPLRADHSSGVRRREHNFLTPTGRRKGGSFAKGNR